MPDLVGVQILIGPRYYEYYHLSETRVLEKPTGVKDIVAIVPVHNRYPQNYPQNKMHAKQFGFKKITKQQQQT